MVKAVRSMRVYALRAFRACWEYYLGRLSVCHNPFSHRPFVPGAKVVEKLQMQQRCKEVLLSKKWGEGHRISIFRHGRPQGLQCAFSLRANRAGVLIDV